MWEEKEEGKTLSSSNILAAHLSIKRGGKTNKKLGLPSRGMLMCVCGSWQAAP